MNDLDRIEHALETHRLDGALFERCAQDILSELYPGLIPIPGGTDWGRDGDVAATGEQVPPRLVVTTSRTLDGVRANMRRGIQSMQVHGVPVQRLILANPASLSMLERRKLVGSAARAGATLDASEIFDRGYFGSRLRRDGYWRHRLLGLPSKPISLSRLAPDVAERGWGFLPLVAREADLAAMRAAGDLIMTGPPGVGKISDGGRARRCRIHRHRCRVGSDRRRSALGLPAHSNRGRRRRP